MIIESILKINPDARVTVYGKDIDTCTFDWNGTPEISKEDIKEKMAELQVEYDAKQYQRDREKEYPSIADQLDDIYHNGIDAWKATIKVTKDKYPK
tara:strand:- start:74 stop:361 length:288 start_codon:yes stop_codon:yes gene_type:complete